MKHTLLEGLKNVTRSFWLSATAISVLTVSLGTFVFITTASTAIGFASRQLNEQLVITAYLNRDITSEEAEAIKKELENEESIKSIRYVNREEATQELTSSNSVTKNLADSLKERNSTLILEFLEIAPKDVDSYTQVIQLLKSEDYNSNFNSINEIQEVRDRLEQIYYVINVGGLILIIIFALISILVMINILRIAIYSHRDEIEIMRLVGATNGYIQGPFIAEGVYFNLIAAFIVLLIFIPGVNLLIPFLEGFLKVALTTDLQSLVYQMYLSIGVTIFAGVCTGIITTYFAIGQYLKL